MTLRSQYQPNHLAVSFELFPPKTSAGESSLYENVSQLMEFAPDFITCTYGAGGSTRHKTLEIVCEIKQRFHIPVASHLTVVGSTVADLRNYLARAAALGVDYIVALRGDPPEGTTKFTPTAGGLQYANELVNLVRGEFGSFGVAVAGYPETHREATSPQQDLDNLKRKVDAGADTVITQLFYKNEDFFRFRDRCRNMGIHVPIVPGLLPVTNFNQIQRIASLCGAKLPREFALQLSGTDDEPSQFKIGVDYAIEQTRSLIDNQVDGLHFYVLNRSQATRRILEAVDIHSTRAV
jgi:methylenetetrahydrofolate reductase (NADPH)